MDWNHRLDTLLFLAAVYIFISSFGEKIEVNVPKVDNYLVDQNSKALGTFSSCLCPHLIHSISFCPSYDMVHIFTALHSLIQAIPLLGYVFTVSQYCTVLFYC